MNEIQQLLNVYDNSLADKMKALAAPLKNHLGIDECIYQHISNGGSFFNISNQPDPSIYYFSQGFFKSTLLIRHPDNYDSGVLFPAVILGEVRKHRMVAKFGYSSDSLLAILRKEPSGVHKFLFNRKNADFSIIHFYMTNLPLFESFCDYFIKEWSHYHLKAEPFKIDLGTLMGPVFFESLPEETLKGNRIHKINFLKDIGSLPKDFILPQELSWQESKCLEWISKGKTLKQTAEFMNLSPRTVEFYYENIKNKMQCQSKSEIMEKINQMKLIGI